MSIDSDSDTRLFIVLHATFVAVAVVCLVAGFVINTAVMPDDVDKIATLRSICLAAWFVSMAGYYRGLLPVLLDKPIPGLSWRSRYGRLLVLRNMALGAGAGFGLLIRAVGGPLVPFLAMALLSLALLVANFPSDAKFAEFRQRARPG